MHSVIVENYIKTIYQLENLEGRATTSLLSEKMQVSPATATDMMKRLADEGIVRHEPYRGVRLTGRGKKHALKIIRRHRLWELFLVQVLDFEWHEIHEEAELLEHCTSEKLEARLDEYLGHPTVDPHGHAIPNSNGEIPNIEYIPLASANPGDTVRLRRVNDDSSDVLQYLSQLGIELGSDLAIVEKIAFDGTMRVRVDGGEQFISEKLANHLFGELMKGGA